MRKDSSLQMAHDAAGIIADAAARATSAIASAAEAAAKVVAVKAEEQAKTANVQPASSKEDHDLLVQLNTRMEGIKKDIADLKDGTSERISNLEHDKLNIQDSYPVLYKAGIENRLKDHEERMRTNETNITRITTWGVALLLVISVVEFLVTKFM